MGVAHPSDPPGRHRFMDTLHWTPTRPSTALCVDDNPDVAESTARLLRANGLDAAACTSGADALATLDERPPDVCLIDLAMPGMSGAELARRLRAWATDRGRPLVLVAVTAHGDPGSRAQTEAAGFDFHLVKPVAVEELLAITLALWNAADPPAELAGK